MYFGFFSSIFWSDRTGHMYHTHHMLKPHKKHVLNNKITKSADYFCSNQLIPYHMKNQLIKVLYLTKCKITKSADSKSYDKSADQSLISH